MQIAFCTPKREMTLSYHFSSLIHLSHLLQERGHVVVFQQQVGCALLEHARSTLASEAHRWGADVQLFVDDDVVVTEPESAIRLIEEAYERQSLVAAPVLTRGGLAYNVRFLDPDPFKPPRVVRALQCGMGCTAIARNVFDRIITDSEMGEVVFIEGTPPLWPFFRSILTSELWMGEDTSFSERARHALDSHLWCDTRCRPEHFGMIPYRRLSPLAQ